MEHQKKDNVIDFRERLARLREKIESKKSITEELMEADFGKFKEMVAFAIDDLYKKIDVILDIHENIIAYQIGLNNAVYYHSHEGGVVVLPEWVSFDPNKDD